jgi:hypothetical protein
MPGDVTHWGGGGHLCKMPTCMLTTTHRSGRHVAMTQSVRMHARLAACVLQQPASAAPTCPPRCALDRRCGGGVSGCCRLSIVHLVNGRGRRVHAVSGHVGVRLHPPTPGRRAEPTGLCTRRPVSSARTCRDLTATCAGTNGTSWMQARGHAQRRKRPCTPSGQRRR